MLLHLASTHIIHAHILRLQRQVGNHINIRPRVSRKDTPDIHDLEQTLLSRFPTHINDT